MHQFNHAEFKNLIAQTQEPLVSIYIPTQTKTRPGETNNQIRFKNALQRAAIRLEEFHLEPGEIKSFLQSAYQLLDDTQFWQYQDHGLAVFIGQDLFKAYCLPIHFEEHLSVNGRFYVAPLVEYFEHENSYYLLNLSLNQIQLFACTQDKIEEVPTDDLPQSLQEIIKYDDFEAQLQHHSGGGTGQAVYHGHADEGFDKKKQIREFCHRLGSELNNLLQDTKRPLLVAGVDYIVAMFQQECQYAGLMDDSLHGNFEHLHPHELHQKSLELVSPVLTQEKEQALKQLQEIGHTGRVSTQSKEIAESAKLSRVGTLFVLKEEQQAEPDSPPKVKLVNQDTPWAETINEAVIETYLNGGDIYTVSAESLEEDTELAAIMRY